MGNDKNTQLNESEADNVEQHSDQSPDLNSEMEGELPNDVQSSAQNDIDMTQETDDASTDSMEPEDDVVQQLSQAQEEITKLKDAFLRAKAEEDNVRRRSEKEIANSRKFAVESFAKEMLNVRDSLKLACAVEVADDADESIKNIHQGVEITLKQLDSAFAKFSLEEVAPQAGDKLDPNLHQAMSMVESDEVESGHILNVIQSGCQLHDRLLRPALVVVAK